MYQERESVYTPCGRYYRMTGTPEGDAAPLPRELTDWKERGKEPNNPASRSRPRSLCGEGQSSPSLPAIQRPRVLMMGRRSIT